MMSWNFEDHGAEGLVAYRMVRPETDQSDGVVLMVVFAAKEQELYVGHMDVDGNFEPKSVLRLGEVVRS